MKPILYKSGDILKRRKALITKHVGIYLGDGFVFHNTPDRGEHVSTIDVFANGQEIEVKPIPNKNRPVVLRAVKIGLYKPKKYNLFLNNCEQTVSKITTGQSSSPQLYIAVLLTAITLYAMAKARRS